MADDFGTKIEQNTTPSRQSSVISFACEIQTDISVNMDTVIRYLTV
jgi:hypothetical protein